jgi:transcriptional regulator with XRE-family HTH domain
MTTTPTRPVPIGVTRRGHPKYDPAEIAAYRKAMRCSQAEVAARLRVSQALIATYEASANTKWEMGEQTAGPILKAVDYLAARRDKMEAEGIAELDAIRSARGHGSR